MRSLRGGALAMIFQEPASALDPSYTVGWQIAEAVRAHRRVGRGAARRRAAELLELVAMPDPRRRLGAYPHQLSGGQQQRVMIAMALAGEPELLLADEPTTALDVTVQAQILDLLDGLRRRLGLTVLLVTHDLAVVAATCDRVLVMYAGEVVEEASAGDLFARPAHPYTRALLAALPRLGVERPRGELPTLAGHVPDPAALPAGCPFHPRCGEAMERCRVEAPGRFAVAGGTGEAHHARCWLHAGAEETS
jgi:oligopeptide/dipeptide ABC transporter ATP-binding protein